MSANGNTTTTAVSRPSLTNSGQSGDSGAQGSDARTPNSSIARQDFARTIPKPPSDAILRPSTRIPANINGGEDTKLQPLIGHSFGNIDNRFDSTVRFPAATTQSDADGSTVATDEVDTALPTYFYLVDRWGRFLTVLDDGTLGFYFYQPDYRSILAGTRSGDNYTLKFNKGTAAIIYLDDDGTSTRLILESSTSDGSFLFHYLHDSDNYIYLEWTFGSTNYFVSCDNRPYSGGGVYLYPDIRPDCKLQVVEASVKTVIYDVVYDLANATTIAETPFLALNAVVDNTSSSLSTTQVMGYSYTVSQGNTWNLSLGVTLGWKGSADAGIPFIANAKMEISVSPTITSQWSQNHIVTTTINESTTVNVPAAKKAQVTVQVKTALLKVPFTCRIKRWWANGTTEDVADSGEFRNQDAYEVEAVVTETSS